MVGGETERDGDRKEGSSRSRADLATAVLPTATTASRPCAHGYHPPAKGLALGAGIRRALDLL